MNDERFERGIELFNKGEFFDAHEVWEDLWHEYRETDRRFLQGLIQLAAGFYHAQCDNSKGALSQLDKGSGKLRDFVPMHAGIDVTPLCDGTLRWLDALRAETRPPPFPHIEKH